jgi:hypothetical protein
MTNSSIAVFGSNAVSKLWFLFAEPPEASVDWTPNSSRRMDMTFGRGALLWLLGIPLPVILLLALFWR